MIDFTKIIGGKSSSYLSNRDLYFHQSGDSFENTKVQIRGIGFWTEYIEHLTSIASIVKKILKYIKSAYEALSRHKKELYHEKCSSRTIFNTFLCAYYLFEYF